MNPALTHKLKRPMTWPAWVRYVCSFFLVGELSELRRVLDPVLGGGSELSTFYIGVILCAYLFGTGCGIFALLLGGIGAEFRFMSPRGQHKLDATVVIAEFFYLLAGCGIIAALRALREARAHAAQQLEESQQRLRNAIAAEHALRESRERYRAAILASHTGTFRWDITNGRIDCDSALARLLGMATADSIRSLQALVERLHGDDRLQFLENCNNCARDAIDFDMEFRVLWPDGTLHWLEGKARTFTDSSGDPSYMTGACTDITRRKHDSAELELARDEALAASQAKSIFLTNMSHELRTPLNAIIGYSEMLKEETDEAGAVDMSRDLARIQAAGQHLLNLINDVLDLSRVEAGKMELSVCRFDVLSALDEAAAMVQPLREKHQNSIDVICQPDVGVMESDETKVKQILYNLMNNAVKFTEQGTIVVEAARERSDGSDWMIFRVSDTGIGMDEKQIANLFQEFYQGDPSSTRRHDGSGLGLAISQRFTQMMGGELKVESRPKSGSTFTLRLPACLRLTPSLN